MNIHPNKLKGQNFLVHARSRKKIIAGADLSPSDTVIEIGPGTGILTAALVPEVSNCILIEIEDACVELLKKRFEKSESVSILHGDGIDHLLRIVSELPEGEKVKLVSNLPYGITSPVLQIMADHADAFDTSSLLIQKEVAERVAAAPGDSERGFLSVILQARYAIRITLHLPPSRFWPPPRVDSAVIIVTPRTDPPEISWPVFRALVSAVFTHRRKTVYNNLRRAYPDLEILPVLEGCQIPRDIRGDAMTEIQFINLCNAIEKVME